MVKKSISCGLPPLGGVAKNSTSTLVSLLLLNLILVDSPSISILFAALLPLNLPFHSLLVCRADPESTLPSTLLSIIMALLAWPLVNALALLKPVGWTEMMLLLDGISGATTMTSLFVAALDSPTSLPSSVTQLSAFLSLPLLAKLLEVLRCLQMNLRNILLI